jgi:hypothetical protein
MISIDWPQLLGALLIGVSGIGGIGYGGKLAWAKWRSLPAGETPIPPGRAADEPAPSGAVEWASDIATAMGAASPQSKLDAILSGCTRDKARALRITELEAGP